MSVLIPIIPNPSPDTQIELNHKIDDSWIKKPVKNKITLKNVSNINEGKYTQLTLDYKLDLNETLGISKSTSTTGHCENYH